MQLTVADIVLAKPLFGIQLPQCTNAPLILLSSLWQMLLWHQVAHAIAIPSGIISMCHAAAILELKRDLGSRPVTCRSHTQAHVKFGVQALALSFSCTATQTLFKSKMAAAWRESI